MRKINVEESIVYKFDSKKDLSECVALLGEQGYFSDNEDFSDYATGTLSEVKCQLKETKYPFIRSNDKEGVVDKYMFFISEDAAVFEEEPKKKKYRPYMYLDELPFNIGDVVIYRCKQCCSECKGIVTEIEYQNNDDCELDNIIIGGINGTPQELFNHYELLDDNCQYRPFGIEE